MVQLEYPIQMEIAGPTAIWTRPDTGDSPVSYPAPTYSAVKGIFEAILWGPAVEIVPTKVEICRPIQYHSYATNYGGPLRDPKNIKAGNNYQLFATVLVDVCYRPIPNITKRAPCIRIVLDGNEVAEIENVPAEKWGNIKKFGNNQGSFPAMNLVPLFRVSDEDVKKGSTLLFSKFPQV